MSDEQQPAVQPAKKTSKPAPRKYCVVSNCGRRPEPDSDRCAHHRARKQRSKR